MSHDHHSPEVICDKPDVAIDRWGASLHEGKFSCCRCVFAAPLCACRVELLSSLLSLLLLVISCQLRTAAGGPCPPVFLCHRDWISYLSPFYRLYNLTFALAWCPLNEFGLVALGAWMQVTTFWLFKRKLWRYPLGCSYGR